eukprot:6212417-Pleurochrysis_carterae.AAC.2
MGAEVGERKRSSSTAPAMCAREVRGDGICAPGWSTFETSSALLSIDKRFSPAASRPDFRSPRFRHVVNCRFPARDNLHRDLDLFAVRPAVLARAQP